MTEKSTDSLDIDDIFELTEIVSEGDNKAKDLDQSKANSPSESKPDTDLSDLEDLFAGVSKKAGHDAYASANQGSDDDFAEPTNQALEDFIDTLTPPHEQDSSAGTLSEDFDALFDDLLEKNVESDENQERKGVCLGEHINGFFETSSSHSPENIDQTQKNEHDFEIPAEFEPEVADIDEISILLQEAGGVIKSGQAHSLDVEGEFIKYRHSLDDLQERIDFVEKRVNAVEDAVKSPQAEVRPSKGPKIRSSQSVKPAAEAKPQEDTLRELEAVQEKLSTVQADLDAFQASVGGFETCLDGLQEKNESLQDQLKAVQENLADEKLRPVENLEAFEARFEQYEKRFAALEDRFDSIDNIFSDIENRLSLVEGQQAEAKEGQETPAFDQEALCNELLERLQKPIEKAAAAAAASILREEIQALLEAMGAEDNPQ